MPLADQLKKTAQKKKDEAKRSAAAREREKRDKIDAEGKKLAEKIIPTLTALMKKEAAKGETSLWIREIHMGPSYDAASAAAYRIREWARGEGLHDHVTEFDYVMDYGPVDGHLTLCWDTHKDRYAY